MNHYLAAFLSKAHGHGFTQAFGAASASDHSDFPV